MESILNFLGYIFFLIIIYTFGGIWLVLAFLGTAACIGLYLSLKQA